MDFSFNSEQKMIAESAATFLADQSDSIAVRRAMSLESGFEPAYWASITQELGWQLTNIPENFDGLGLGVVELAILFEQMGIRLSCSPFFSTVALGVNTLLLAGSTQQKEQWLPKIANDGVRLAFAYSAQGRVWGSEAVNASYQKTDDGYKLDGDYHYVVDGHSCDVLFFAAKGDAGIKLFISPATAHGINRSWTPTLDQTRKSASVKVSDLTIPLENVLLGGDKEFEQILALASICLAAEQMGVAQAALNQTVEYISQRSQFGRTVGSFQAMKHKAADMLNKVEAARSSVYYAACIADEFFAHQPMGEELLEAASIAKAYCCEAAYFNTGSAIQMHGGVGFTWEYDIHMYFKRAKAGQVSFGDTAMHKERIAAKLFDELPIADESMV